MTCANLLRCKIVIAVGTSSLFYWAISLHENTSSHWKNCTLAPVVYTCRTLAGLGMRQFRNTEYWSPHPLWSRSTVIFPISICNTYQILPYMCFREVLSAYICIRHGLHINALHTGNRDGLHTYALAESLNSYVKHGIPIHSLVTLALHCGIYFKGQFWAPQP